jgi:multidrug efflux pump subunit AcrA (membrane-fusion protein)
VTRFTPFLDPEKGRTMRAEVDIYNPPEHGFRISLQKGMTSFVSPLGSGQALESAVLTAAGSQIWGRQGLLKAGMYGTMQLLLQAFDNAPLIPSSAVFSRDGKTFVFMVDTPNEI